MMPPYNSAKHEDSEFYRLNSANVGNPAPIEYEQSEENYDETYSAECISINDVREEGDSGSKIDDNSEPRIPTDEDIAIRAQAEIAAMMCLSRNTSCPHMQRRYINPEAASEYKKQHQLLLAITKRIRLPKGDKEAFAFMERHERGVHRQRRSV